MIKVFFSYGHDKHAKFVQKIKDDLNKKGSIEVWLDSEELKAKDDWEHELEKAIEKSDEIVYFITPYSARRPDGYCLNELAFSIVNGKKITPIMLDYTTPPLSICRIQYMDIQHIVENFDKKQYDDFITNLIQVLETNLKLEYEGTHLNLLTQLNPIDFTADIKKHLVNYVGREWLYDQVDALLQKELHQVIWIKAEAGFGKTAFSTILHHKHANAVGIHYCQFDSVKRKTSLNVIKTLIFQLSTQISKYNEILFTLNTNDINNKDENEILEQFLIEPLNKIELEDNYFFIIDAIDEAIENGKNKLADLIKKFSDLPSWLKIVITSRPEPYLNRKLSKLKTIEINTASDQNYSDLHLYLDSYLEHESCDILKKETIRKQLITNSEGNILYLKEIIEGIIENQIDESDIMSMPRGMDGLYTSMFERYFEDLSTYKAYQRPLFELMSSLNRQISLTFISQILQWDEYDLEDTLEPIGSIVEIENNNIKFFHKSISDWITDREKSGRNFFVSQKKGNERIVDFLLNQNIKTIAKLADNFNDILIIFNALYTIGFDEIDKNDEKVKEIYECCINIKENVLENQTFKQILEQNNIDGELDFILYLTSMDYEVSKSLISSEEKFMFHHVLASKNYAYMLKEVGKIEESIKIQEYIQLKVEELYNNNIEQWAYTYADLLNELAQAYSSIGKIKEAIDTDNISLAIIEINYDIYSDKWNRLYTSCLNSLAVSYGNFNNIHKAIELDEKSKKIIETLYANDNDKWVEYYIKSLNNLAISYKDVGRTNTAILLEEELLEIIKPLYTKNRIKWVNDYALILNNLAFTYKSTGKINESINLEEKALSLTEGQYNTNKGYWTHLYVKSLLNLALSYKNIWKIEEAIELEQKAITITQKLYEQDKLRWADIYTRSLTCLGISISKTDNHYAAYLLEDKSLSIREDLFKHNPQRWIDAYTLSVNNSAITHKQLNMIEESKALLEKNLDIRRNYYIDTPKRWADHYTESLINMSIFKIFDNDIDTAMILQEEALNIKSSLYQNNPDLWSESYSKNLSVYGYSHFHKNNLNKAIGYEEEAFYIRKKLFNEHNIRWVHCYLLSIKSLAISYYFNSQYKEANQLQSLILSLSKELNNYHNIKKWLEINFKPFLAFNLLETTLDNNELKTMKYKIINLEFLEKKSPHRWSDAFK